MAARSSADNCRGYAKTLVILLQLLLGCQFIFPFVLVVEPPGDFLVQPDGSAFRPALPQLQPAPTVAAKVD